MRREIAGLEALEYQMDRNVESMKRSWRDAQYFETWQGQALHWAGVAFSIYCVFRTVSVRPHCFSLISKVLISLV